MAVQIDVDRFEARLKKLLEGWRVSPVCPDHPGRALPDVPCCALAPAASLRWCERSLISDAGWRPLCRRHRRGGSGGQPF